MGEKDRTGSDGRALVVFAHPALEHGRVNPAMADGARKVAGVEIHDLYEAYPDFTIDVRAEQKRLLKHDLIVLQFPLYWFSAPALLREWMDLVWTEGFAYGEGRRLEGRRLMCAVTTAGVRASYDDDGNYLYPLHDFLRPLETAAGYCGLQWVDPFVLHGPETRRAADLKKGVGRYKDRLEQLISRSDEPRSRSDEPPRARKPKP